MRNYAGSPTLSNRFVPYGDGAAISTLTRPQREDLTASFGLHGAESILLASMPGQVLWTDDSVLANAARDQFGVRRIWTQAALMGRVQAGALEASALATAATKLAGWGLHFHHPEPRNPDACGRALRMDSRISFPLKQVRSISLLPKA